jgi:hypothetical protein
MKLFKIIFFLVCLSLSSETIQLDQVSIFWKGEVPPKVFRNGLVFNESEIYLGTEFHKSYLETYSEPSESFMVLETKKELPEIIKFYETFFQENNWKTLKKIKKAKSFVLVCESVTHRMITVLILDKENKRTIKLLHKKQVSF